MARKVYTLTRKVPKLCEVTGKNKTASAKALAVHERGSSCLGHAIFPLPPAPRTEPGQGHKSRAEENHRSRQRNCRDG